MRYTLILALFFVIILERALAQDEKVEKGVEFLTEYDASEDIALLDSAILYFKLSREAYKEDQAFEKWLSTSQKLQGAYVRLVDQGELDDIFLSAFLDTVISEIWRTPQTEVEWGRLGTLYINRAFSAYMLEDYYSAKIHYEKGREIFEIHSKDQEYLANYIYNPLGKVYLNLKDYNLAKYYTQKYIGFVSTNEAIANGMSDLARIYQSEGEYQDAQSALEQALRMEGIEKATQALLYTNLGAMFVETGSWDKAVPQLLAAISYYESQDRIEAIEAYRLLGLAYLRKKEYTLAKDYFEQAISAISMDEYAQFYSSELSLIHSYIGYWFKEQGRIEEALKSYHKALYFLIPETDSSNIYESPLAENLYPEPLILDILEAKGDAFSELFDQDKKPENLMYALHAYQMVSKMEEVLQLSHDNEAAKLDLLERSHSRTESALEIAYKLYDQTGDSLIQLRALDLVEKDKDVDYLSAIFNISESSKSTILLESLKELEAQMLSKIPDSLEAELYKLKANWRYCQRYYQALRQEQADESELRIWEEKSIRASNAYQAFMQDLEEQQGNYVAIKREMKPISLSYIRTNLIESSQALLEYFVGEHHIYLFVIDQKTTHFLRFERPEELSQWISGLLSSISSNNFSNTEDYISYSRKLYDSLIQPIVDANIKLPTKLKIVPDGILSYLPFETLLSTEPTNRANFKAYDYLIKKHTVSYIYSARLLEQILALEQSKGHQKSFLGVAPVFENSKRFTKLHHSVEEVQSLCKSWKGEALIGSNANKAYFLDHAPKYDILHIYSHAFANAEAPHASYIGFYDEQFHEDEGGLLHLADIYAMKLNASMVVLSACETQTGLLHEGEGLMSLARGFMYAGSRSVVGTRWKVNNNSTSKIMRKFYEELANGESKDVALAKAKIHYLLEDEETDKIQAHPYFWAAYAPIGDMKTLSPPNKFPKWIAVLAFLLFISIVGYKVFRPNKS